jgi:hypothetical protein
LKLTIFLSRFAVISIECFVLFSVVMNAALGNTQPYTACPTVGATFLGIPPKQAHLSLMVVQRNLVIQEQISPNQFKSHQVTFHKPDSLNEQLSEACEITPIALIQGANWGWHVLWQSSQGIYYARVDGEAWVSVPKRLAEQQGVDVSMAVDKETVTVQWKTTTSSQQVQRAVSVDEGRSWH